MKCYNDFIVNTKILKENFFNIKNKVGKDVKICAVVKANAYSIGMETVCKTLYGLVDFFACASLKEALSIRVFDKKTPILILGQIENNELDIVSDNNISISINSLDQLIEIDKNISKNINVHIQINTGLNRFGIRKIKDFNEALKIIDNSNYINIEGLYSHFATKSEDVEFMNKQFFRFLQFKKYLNNNKIICHIANSYGLLHSDKYHLNMVRPGFLLYGYTENTIGNKPVLTIKSKVMSIIDTKRGETVGYGRTYRVNKSGKIAVIPLGYADGFGRRLSNNFHVIINNKKYPVVGRICMDVFMVNIGSDNIKVGDSVIILGTSNNLKITIEDYANIIETSNYEVLCGFNYKRMNYIIDNK